MLFKLPLYKTVQFQCSYFYRTARLWNILPFVIRDASSLHNFRKNFNELYLTMVNSLMWIFDAPGAWRVLL